MLEVKDARISYGDVEVLRGVSLAVSRGEVVVLAGANGSGKSTVAALACGGSLARTGTVSVDGIDPAASEADRRCVRTLVGMVQQDPVDQIVSTLVRDDVAFGPRNLGLPEDEVERRVEEALRCAGLSGFGDREAASLSGGELQRLALAGVLAMRPRYLVLDEVTSMLDGALRPAVRRLIASLAHRDGIGILTITHDPVELATADRVVVLDAGAVSWTGTPAGLMREQGLWERLAGRGVLARAARDAVRAGIDLLGIAEAAGEPVPAPSAPVASARAAYPSDGGASAGLVLRHVAFSYPESDAPSLRDVSLGAAPGEILLLAGASGSGKSTTARVAAGLEEPDGGSVLLDGTPVEPGSVGLAFQRPEAQLFLDTVRDEFAFGPRNLGMRESEVEARARSAAERAGIAFDLLDRYPFDLSGGQQRRVGIADTLALDAGACILDEPTAGLDAAGREAVHELARGIAREGRPLIVISHDLDEWLDVADSVALMTAGRVAWEGSVPELLACPGAWALAGLPLPLSLAIERRLGGGEAGKASLSSSAMPARTDCRPCAPASVSDPVAAPASRPALSGHRSRGARVLGSYGSPDAPLAAVDARVKIILLLAATVAAFAAPSPWTLAAGFLLLAVALRAACADVRAVAAAVRPISVILAFTLLANLVSCDGLARGAGVALSWEGGLRGLMAAARIVLLLGLSLAVSASTTPTEISDAAVRLMRPLARLGVPVGDIGTVLSIALRFIPVVAEEFGRIRLAQRARGARFDRGSVLHRVRLHASILTPLVVGLFRRSDRLARSMAQRGYDGGSVIVPPAALARRDRLLLAAGLVACAALVAVAR